VTNFTTLTGQSKASENYTRLYGTRSEQQW
jgi:hypothetical protein